MWKGDELPVIAEVQNLPSEVRRAFVDQWRARLDLLKKKKKTKPVRRKKGRAGDRDAA